jgi:hypothetical protein
MPKAQGLEQDEEDIAAKMEAAYAKMKQKAAAREKRHKKEMPFGHINEMKRLFLPLHPAFLRFIYHYTPTNEPNLFFI